MPIGTGRPAMLCASASSQAQFGGNRPPGGSRAFGLRPQYGGIDVAEPYFAQQMLDSTDRRRPHGESPQPDGRQAGGVDRAAGVQSAIAQRRSGRCASPDDQRKKIEIAQTQRVVSGANPLVFSVCGEEELLQVVSADRDEIRKFIKICPERKPEKEFPASRLSRRTPARPVRYSARIPKHPENSCAPERTLPCPRPTGT